MAEFFDEKIALFHKSIASTPEALKNLSDVLYAKSLVTEDFYQNLWQREQEFPTGLDINGIGVALPHTESIYVKRSQVGFLSLKEPITFYEMGTNDKPVQVKILFMLALKEPHEQLSMLQNLISMFQKEGTLQKLLEVDNTEDYLSILHKNGLY